MQKSSWKYKRVLNQIVFALRRMPKLVWFLKNIIFTIRLLARKSKPVSADVAVEKLYSEKSNYLYVANPKVATRSIIGYFEKNDIKNVQINHQTMFNFFSMNPAISTYYRFSFVRNPWARAYSCWLDKITNQHKFCDFSIISRYKGLYPDMPFNAFIEWLSSEEGKDQYADRHWMSQCELLGGINEIKKFDFIGKIEHIEADFRLVADHLNIGPKNLSALNLNQKNPLSYREKYSDKTKTLIANRYIRDIECFDYKF